jgi:hypothetical protein
MARTRDVTNNDQESPLSIKRYNAWQSVTIRENVKSEKDCDMTRSNARKSDYVWLNINRSIQREKKSQVWPFMTKVWLRVSKRDYAWQCAATQKGQTSTTWHTPNVTRSNEVCLSVTKHDEPWPKLRNDDHMWQYTSKSYRRDNIGLEWP